MWECLFFWGGGLLVGTRLAKFLVFTVELEGIRFFGTSFTKSETYYGELSVKCEHQWWHTTVN
jgi:hypothetical protein